MSDDIILEIKNLNVDYISSALGKKKTVRAVNNLSLDIKRGEILAIAGESGCGKSTLSKAIIRLVEPISGEIIYNGRNVYDLKGANLKGKQKKDMAIFEIDERSAIRIYPFMTPTYLLRYFIKKLNLNQKVVNVFSVISISLMYLFTIFNWISVFISEEQEMESCAGLFMIPFLSLLKTASVISVLAGGCRVYEFLKKMKEE